MSASERKVILITGASSGIGAECVRQLGQEGHRVYGTSRRERATGLDGVEMLQLDVTDDGSVQAVVSAVLDREGRIDVLVNNAGYGLAGAVEHTSLEEAKAQFDVNFFGYLRMARAVLPGMRARRQGVIVNISSLGGLIGLPFQSLYSASKFAIEGWSEGLAIEVGPDNVRVVLIEPSDMQTGFTRNRQRVAAARIASPLSERMERVLAIVERDEGRGPPPGQVAVCVSRALKARRPRLRYRVGLPSQASSALMKQWLPDRLFGWMLRMYYALPGAAP